VIVFLAHNLWWVLGLLVMAAAIAAPALLWRLRWPVAVAIACAFAAVFWLRANDLDRQLLQAHADRADQAAKRAQFAIGALQRRRALDADHAEAVASLTAEYKRDNDDAQHAIDDLRRRVRAGDVQLRDRFRCPVTAAEQQPAPGAGAAAGGTAGEARSGLLPADVDVLLGLAAEADAVVRERNLAVDVANAYRAACAAPVTTP